MTTPELGRSNNRYSRTTSGLTPRGGPSNQRSELSACSGLQKTERKEGDEPGSLFLCQTHQSDLTLLPAGGVMMGSEARHGTAVKGPPNGNITHRKRGFYPGHLVSQHPTREAKHSEFLVQKTFSTGNSCHRVERGEPTNKDYKATNELATTRCHRHLQRGGSTAAAQGLITRRILEPQGCQLWGCSYGKRKEAVRNATWGGRGGG